MWWRASIKKIAIATISVIVIINVLYFLLRSVLSFGCDLDTIMSKRHRSSIKAYDGVPSPPDPAEFLLSGQAGTAGHSDFRCHSGVPCEYPVEEEVRIRIIVLTFERWESLLKLLSSINDLYMDGDRGSIEIWIDRSKKTNEVSKQVLRCAESFLWKHGHVRVHVQDHHVGIYGQWINTWRPRLNDTSSVSANEIVLILEDDLSISPFAYRWLRAAHRYYQDRTDLAGITLQSEGLVVATTGHDLHPPRDGSVTFLYSLLGSWGFSPQPTVWRNFQDWYHTVSKSTTFRPYVNGLLMTSWYKDFEKKKKEDSMWTMWFIYYCHKNQLFTLYSNLNAYNGNNSSCMAVNRREPGLHFKGHGKDNSALLLRKWSEEFVRFDNHSVQWLSFAGKRI